MEEGNCKGISMDVGLLFGQTLRGGGGCSKVYVCPFNRGALNQFEGSSFVTIVNRCSTDLLRILRTLHPRLYKKNKIKVLFFINLIC